MHLQRLPTRRGSHVRIKNARRSPNDEETHGSGDDAAGALGGAPTPEGWSHDSGDREMTRAMAQINEFDAIVFETAGEHVATRVA